MEAERWRLRGELTFTLFPQQAAEAEEWIGKAISVADAQRAEPFLRRAEQSLAVVKA